MRFVLPGLLLLAPACGLEKQEDNPSCCYYVCTLDPSYDAGVTDEETDAGPRAASYSSYFGREEECQRIAVDRCQLAPGNLPPGPIEFEPIPPELIEGEGKPSLDQVCRTRFADFLTRIPN